MQSKGLRNLLRACAISALLGGIVPTSPWSASAQTKASQDEGSRSKKKRAVDETATSPAPSTNKSVETGMKKHRMPTKNASDSEIQAAKASGKVWVNTETGVYHKGGQWYGATKQGKFMTEQEASKAGFRPAKNEK